MKQTLLVLASGFLMASCGMGDNDQTVALQKQVDSLVKLVPQELNVNVESTETTGLFTTHPVAAYYMPKTTADSLIQGFHGLFKNNGVNQDAKIPFRNMNRSAFVIPANTLKTLVNAPNSCPYVVFYIGYDKESKDINLIYTGVKSVGADSFSEITFTDPSIPNKPMVFDHSMPCPTCLGIGVHSQNGTFSTVIYATLEGEHGTLSPSGDMINVRYGKNQTFTYQPDNGYMLDELKVDGVVITDSPTQYTFNSVKETHTITVKFKHAQ